MARPSRNLDKKLLQLGKKILLTKGPSALSVRALCEKCDVNLGMFTYLFKTKDRFVEQVHRELFAELMQELHAATQQSKSSAIDALKQALVTLAKLAKQHKSLFHVLIRDTMSREPNTVRMTAQFIPEDILLLMSLIKKCQSTGQLPARLHPAEILTSLLGGVMAPVIFGAGLVEKLSEHLPELNGYEVDHIEYVSMRIDMLITALNVYSPQSIKTERAP
jgi:AcrR family transcriptional regulator